MAAEFTSRRRLGLSLRGLNSLFSAVCCDEFLVILVGIHSKTSLLDNADLNGNAASQNSQLFQFFQLFQRSRAHLRQLCQEIAPVGIKAKMLQKARRIGGKVGFSITNMGDRAAAEAARSPIGIADHFYAVGVLPLVRGTKGDSKRRHVRSGVLNKQFGEQIERLGFDGRFIALQIDDKIGVELSGDLGDTIGAAGMVAAQGSRGR